jgi:parvulin-like peptidyl-prolyl isomerase
VHNRLRTLKARGRVAECMRVPPLRKRLASALILLVLVAPALTGCAMPAGSARAQAGVAGEILEQLKREDDELEGQERAAMRQADQERQEAEAEREIEWH